jgi:hypothetical protein
LIQGYDYIDVLTVTFLVIVSFTILFAFAILLRGCYLVRCQRQMKSIGGIVKQRMGLAVAIMGTLSYLQLTTRMLQTLVCVQIQDEYYLLVDPTVECYTSKHWILSVLASLVILLYSVLFPAWTFYYLYRGKKSSSLSDRQHISFNAPLLEDDDNDNHDNSLITSRRSIVGLSSAAQQGQLDTEFMSRETRKDFYWFRSLAFVTNAGLAIQDSVAAGIEFRLFLAALFFVCNILMVAWIWPFDTHLTNLAVIAGKFSHHACENVHQSLLSVSMD